MTHSILKYTISATVLILTAMQPQTLLADGLDIFPPTQWPAEDVVKEETPFRATMSEATQ